MHIPSFRSSFFSIIIAVAFFTAGSGVSRAQISLTIDSNQYTQNFNSLTSGATSSDTYTDNSTIPGLYVLMGQGPIGTGAATSIPALYYIQDGTNPTPGIGSFGTSAADRAFGSVVTDAVTGAGTGFITYGFRFVNNDPTHSITQFTLSYRGEQWRRNNTASQTLAFSYGVFDSGMGGLDMPTGYASDTVLNFTTPGGTTAGGLLFASTQTDTITATVRPGQELYVRWVDANDVGNDHNVAIDDLSFSATFDPTPAPPGFVTACIGSAVGAAHFAVGRWRSRRTLRKKQTGRRKK